MATTIQDGSYIYKKLLESVRQLGQKEQQRETQTGLAGETGSGSTIRETLQGETQKLGGTVGQAKDYLQSQTGGGFQSKYSGQIADLYKQIMERPKFSYDPNKDPLYSAYRDQYMQSGQLAMRDAMGTAAGLTGGYGNSWGDTAGFQAYQAYLQQMTGMIPELEQQAYQRYQDEGEELLQKLSLAQELKSADFAQYQAKLLEKLKGQQGQQGGGTVGGTGEGYSGDGKTGTPAGAQIPTIQGTIPGTESILHKKGYGEMTETEQEKWIKEIEKLFQQGGK